MTSPGRPQFTPGQAGGRMAEVLHARKWSHSAASSKVRFPARPVRSTSAPTAHPASALALRCPHAGEKAQCRDAARDERGPETPRCQAAEDWPAVVCQRGSVASEPVGCRSRAADGSDAECGVPAKIRAWSAGWATNCHQVVIRPASTTRVGSVLIVQPDALHRRGLSISNLGRCSIIS